MYKLFVVNLAGELTIQEFRTESAAKAAQEWLRKDIAHSVEGHTIPLFATLVVVDVVGERAGETSRHKRESKS